MDDQPGQNAARTNQARSEPLPATPESPPGQEAVRRNEELGNLGAALGEAAPGRPADPVGDQRLPRLDAGIPAAEAPADAPGVQATRADRAQDVDDAEEPWRVGVVANAVHGRPDGEVDTRADQPATGTDTP